MSEAPELKPCQFCEGAAWINDYEAKHSAMPARSRCPQCKSCGCSLGYHPTESKAIAAWNRRADLMPAPSVTVKPLVWEDDKWRSRAVGAGSKYLIELSHNGSWYYGDVVWSFATLDAAKAAAQADYEARIMAAIQIDMKPNQAACALCEDQPKAPNNPCAVCGRFSPSDTGPRRATPEALASLRAGEGFATSGAEARWIEDMKAGVYDADMPAPGWQTIETAPMDGTPILASGLDHGKGPSRHYSVVEWIDFGCVSGWYPDEDAYPHIYLTHWMPLPKPPTKDSTND